MASARSARSARPEPRRPAPARPRGVAAPLRRPGPRWDRLGRAALLCVFCGVGILYIHPLFSIWTARGEAQRRHQDVVRLTTEHRALIRRQQALRDPQALQSAARRLGMVHTGEKAYVVTGLPDTPR